MIWNLESLKGVFLSQLQMICEKFARCEKHARCKKLARKKGTHEITRKLTKHVSRFTYFLVQLNFILYCTRKFLCLMHNYCFYSWLQMIHEMSVRHKKHARHDTCVRVILYFFATSWDRFLVSRIWNCLVVEAVIMYQTKEFSRAIRDKI